MGNVATLGDVFRVLALDMDCCVAERNGEVCVRPFSNVIMSDGDVLEIVQFVGGG